MVRVGVDVDKLRLQLGIQNRLAGVEALIAGEHIAQAAGQCKIQKALRAEQLHRQQRGRQRAVRYAAEHRRKAHSRAKPGGQSQQRRHSTAKGSSHKKGGYHLAALKARRQSNGREQQL